MCDADRSLNSPAVMHIKNCSVGSRLKSMCSQLSGEPGGFMLQPSGTRERADGEHLYKQPAR